MYKMIILIFIVSSSMIKAEYVSFAHEGYTSIYARQNLEHKSHNRKIGKYNLSISYDILARWKTSFLMQDPLTYADFIYKITEVTIYVANSASTYDLMGASTDFNANLKTIAFIGKEKSKILKNLVRISGLKVKIVFTPEDDSLSGTFIVDGGVGAKNYGGDENIKIPWNDQKHAKEQYFKIDSKYKSFNTNGSPKWEELFMYRSWQDDPKKSNMETAKKKGGFFANIEDIVIDYSNLVSYVEQNILLKKKQKKETKSSLMLLIDASGSMSGSRFSAAKSAAISNARKAISKNVEVSVAFFGGDCSDTNVLHVHDFTLDANSLASFIQNASTMGGTPLSLALKQANEYLYSHRSKSSKSETVLLLGDGEGSCGNIQSVINNLKSNNTFAHHETIGLEVGTSSNASSQLARIATQSGGNYHTSNSVAELERVFEDASDIEELSDMVGSFGNVNNQHKNLPSNNSMQSILNDFD